MGNQGFSKTPALVIAILAATALWMAGCGGEKPPSGDSPVVVVGGTVLTRDGFDELFRLAEAEMASQDLMDSGERKTARLRFLDGQVEELLILERGRELGLSVSGAELDAAVAAIAADYPEEAFQKTFTEQAVPFSLWKKALGRRLLIQKVIRAELGEEAAKFPATAESAPPEPLPYTPGPGRIEGRDNLEAAYAVWIASLKKRYTVTLSRELL